MSVIDNLPAVDLSTGKGAPTPDATMVHLDEAMLVVEYSGIATYTHSVRDVSIMQDRGGRPLSVTCHDVVSGRRLCFSGKQITHFRLVPADTIEDDTHPGLPPHAVLLRPRVEMTVVHGPLSASSAVSAASGPAPLIADHAGESTVDAAKLQALLARLDAALSAPAAPPPAPVGGRLADRFAAADRPPDPFYKPPRGRIPDGPF